MGGSVSPPVHSAFSLRGLAHGSSRPRTYRVFLHLGSAACVCWSTSKNLCGIELRGGKDKKLESFWKSSLEGRWEERKAQGEWCNQVVAQPPFLGLEFLTFDYQNACTDDVNVSGMQNTDAGQSSNMSTMRRALAASLETEIAATVQKQERKGSEAAKVQRQRRDTRKGRSMATLSSWDAVGSFNTTVESCASQSRWNQGRFLRESTSESSSADAEAYGPSSGRANVSRRSEEVGTHPRSHGTWMYPSSRTVTRLRGVATEGKRVFQEQDVISQPFSVRAARGRIEHLDQEWKNFVEIASQKIQQRCLVPAMQGRNDGIAQQEAERVQFSQKGGERGIEESFGPRGQPGEDLWAPSMEETMHFLATAMAEASNVDGMTSKTMSKSTKNWCQTQMAGQHCSHLLDQRHAGSPQRVANFNLKAKRNANQQGQTQPPQTANSAWTRFFKKMCCMFQMPSMGLHGIVTTHMRAFSTRTLGCQVHFHGARSMVKTQRKMLMQISRGQWGFEKLLKLSSFDMGKVAMQHASLICKVSGFVNSGRLIRRFPPVEPFYVQWENSSQRIGPQDCMIMAKKHAKSQSRWCHCHISDWLFGCSEQDLRTLLFLLRSRCKVLLFVGGGDSAA